MSMPGRLLSHPASVTRASKRSACITVSTESAMTSRRHERRPHPLVAHRDAVGHGDRRELDRVAAGGPHAVLRPLRQPVERHVAGRDLVPAARHRDLGLVPVVLGHADGPQHRPRRRPLVALGHLAAAMADVQRRALVTHGREARQPPVARRRSVWIAGVVVAAAVGAGAFAVIAVSGPTERERSRAASDRRCAPPVRRARTDEAGQGGAAARPRRSRRPADDDRHRPPPGGARAAGPTRGSCPGHHRRRTPHVRGRAGPRRHLRPRRRRSPRPRLRPRRRVALRLAHDRIAGRRADRLPARRRRPAERGRRGGAAAVRARVVRAAPRRRARLRARRLPLPRHR